MTNSSGGLLAFKEEQLERRGKQNASQQGFVQHFRMESDLMRSYGIAFGEVVAMCALYSDSRLRHAGKFLEARATPTNRESSERI